MKLKKESDEFDIISVYRSSDSNQSKQYNFSKQVLSMVNEYKKTLILGDFNFSALVNADNADNGSSHELAALLLSECIQFSRKCLKNLPLFCT